MFGKIKQQQRGKGKVKKKTMELTFWRGKKLKGFERFSFSFSSHLQPLLQLNFLFGCVVYRKRLISQSKSDKWKRKKRLWKRKIYFCYDKSGDLRHFSCRCYLNFSLSIYVSASFSPSLFMYIICRFIVWKLKKLPTNNRFHFI